MINMLIIYMLCLCSFEYPVDYKYIFINHIDILIILIANHYNPMIFMKKNYYCD